MRGIGQPHEAHLLEARRSVEGLLHCGLPHCLNTVWLDALGAIEIDAESLTGGRPIALQRCERNARCPVPGLCRRIDSKAEDSDLPLPSECVHEDWGIPIIIMDIGGVGIALTISISLQPAFHTIQQYDDCLGYAPSSAGPVHFGLGSAKVIDKVEIRWLPEQFKF